jgi:catechol 2,3-dioxygenase-like lactoylglutathione lyase family enzyme
MHTRTTSFTLLITLLFCQAVFAQGDSSESEFATPTIAIGCVVSDIDASVKFYTEAIGFKVASGFEVDADFATDSGLTNQKSLDVKVLKLGKGQGATSLKLMQVEGVSEKPVNDFINSSLGFSYLTIVVKSTDAAMERLKKYGVKPLAKGPIALAANPKMALTLVRDPDGNFVELIGPTPAE